VSLVSQLKENRHLSANRQDRLIGMDVVESKRAAAHAALAELPADGIIGLGTGSTVRYFIEALGTLVASGRRYVGVPTSQASRALAESVGIPLLDDDGPWDIAVTVDGADEVDEQLNLIKGGGGAHTREKIVNAASQRNVIVVDEDKLSAQLGQRRAVPIEVLPFGHLATRAHLARFGEPVIRAARSDAGNLLYDVSCGAIADPAALDRALRGIPGVVETGLFVGRADLIVVGGARRITRG
jgi:ribose 5-phosphate isomerase A